MPNRADNFRNLFNTISDFFFILDQEGNILEVNNAVLEQLGYNRKDLIGKSVLQVHPEHLRNEAAFIVGEMLCGRMETCPLPLNTKNNIEIPVETRIYRSTWNDKEVVIGLSRNLSEIALSESKFYNVFESSQALIAITEIDTDVFINVNKNFTKVLGFEKSEILGKSFRDLGLIYDNGKLQQLTEKAQNFETIENEYVIIKTKDNKLIHTLLSVTRIHVQTFSYLLTSAIDISELKKTEERLSHSLHQQTFLADISQSLLSIDDLNTTLSETVVQIGKYINVSRVYIFEDNTDGTHTSNTYEWCNEGVAPQIQDLQDIPYEIIPSWKKILNEKGHVFSTNIQELPADLISVLEPQGIKSILIFPLYVQSQFYGFIGFDECNVNKNWEHEEIELLRTVSGLISGSFERLRYQQQLKESEIRFKSAIENTSAGLWDWNIETDEVYYSSIWRLLLGYNQSDIEPTVNTWYKLIHPDDQADVFRQLSLHLQKRSEIYEATYRLKHNSGEWRWMIDRGKVIEYNNEGKPVRAIGTIIDIGKQKETEEQLRNLISTKDKLFSIIAHDLRGPLGTIMQLSETVSQRGALSEEALYTRLQSQKELSQSTFHLLENLLNWAVYNRDQIKYEPTIININQIIRDSIYFIRLRAQQKRILVIEEYADDFTAFADENMVRLVVRNLLSNAVKFTPFDGMIRIEITSDETAVHIFIKDSGLGMSAESIEKILSENEFHSTYGTDKEKGSGLGLKLCKNFVELNKGKFIIESEVGVGSEFSFTLPLKDGQPY